MPYRALKGKALILHDPDGSNYVDAFSMTLPKVCASEGARKTRGWTLPASVKSLQEQEQRPTIFGRERERALGPKGHLQNGEQEKEN
jgi:hypothetical protein